jgi:hypothetical protein
VANVGCVGANVAVGCVGNCEGAGELGANVLGERVGSPLGEREGDRNGTLLGLELGRSEGALLGLVLGRLVGV